MASHSRPQASAVEGFGLILSPHKSSMWTGLPLALASSACALTYARTDILQVHILCMMRIMCTMCINLIKIHHDWKPKSLAQWHFGGGPGRDKGLGGWAQDSEQCVDVVIVTVPGPPAAT